MVPDWFYAEQGQQKGPVTFEVLQALAAEGRLRPSDLVWNNGMADWAPASTQPGLFAAPAPTPNRADHAHEWAPQQFERGYERPLTRRPQPGMSSGLKLVLFGGGGGLLLLALCCGVVAVIGTAVGDKSLLTTKPSNERTWNLNTGQHQHWAIPFNKGDSVVIKVTSNLDSDVDLFVFTDQTKMNRLMQAGNIERNVALCIAFDNSPSKDCEVRFTAPETGTYYVLVANRKSMDQPHRNRTNHGKLTFNPTR